MSYRARSLSTLDTSAFGAPCLSSRCGASCVQWTLAKVGEEGGYVNFAADDDQDRVRANYGANYDRLVAVKRQYDPDNLFRNNQNIKPDGATG